MVIIPDLGDFCVNKIVISSHPSSSLINRIKISPVRVAAILFLEHPSGVSARNLTKWFNDRRELISRRNLDFLV